MIDLKHELGFKYAMTAKEITETLNGFSMGSIVNNILLKLQELDLALRKIPELHDTHLTSLRELIGNMHHDHQTMMLDR